MSDTVVAYDLEVYLNYFLASFYNVETENVRHFELFDDECFSDENVRIITTIMAQAEIVGFNSINYDLPILSLALLGAKPKQLKGLSDDIIVGGKRWWQHDHHIVHAPDHIDIMEVAPNRGSLKIYSGRLHARKMQDLPIEPSAIITTQQAELLRTYCENDLRNTALLYKTLKPQIELRKLLSAEYSIDLRSKSDAQIAEAIIKKEVENLSQQTVTKPGECPGHSFQYQVPHFIRFSGDALNHALDVVRSALFVVNDTGSVNLPAPIGDLKITLGSSLYQMGIGGLHSTEKKTAHFSDEDYLLIDRDVASYYPAIILNGGYAPTHMGKNFTKVYSNIVHRRLKAKRDGDKVTSDSLKITINGSFGKFGSKYSVLYSPELLIQTTITGQLSLLMLIEMLEDKGISVVSANTDGVVIKCPRRLEAVMELVIHEWERATGFETEETNYRALYSRDVNNYIALKDEGFKVKGAYSPANLMKNPTNLVVTQAVVAYLDKGTPMVKTITECTDIRAFLTIRTVNGGAVDQEGNLLGKAIRWYYSTSVEEPLRVAKNNNKVPRSEGARALMDLPNSFPTDINYTWYIEEAEKVLGEIGAKAA